MIGFEIRKKNLVPMHVQTIKQLFYFKRMFDRILHLQGDIIECGVGKGRSFFFLASLIDNEGKERNLWGFDSFEGFPQPTIEDTSPRNPQKGEWKKSTPEDIFYILKKGGIKENFLKNKVKIIKGFFENTLKMYQGDSIALLHIDADLYQSYKQVLEEFFPKVVKGGVVLFDEYNKSDWPGATLAINDYFKKTNYKISYDEVADKYYIIK